MFAIPFMEVLAPAAERTLDTNPDVFRPFYEEALPRVYGYSLRAAAAPSRSQKTSRRRRFSPPSPS